MANMWMFAKVLSGISMALFLNTIGGIWDNAKKYVESEAYRGKLARSIS
jgi:Na+/H+-translocating membrane pyrophosphatase